MPNPADSLQNKGLLPTPASYPSSYLALFIFSGDYLGQEEADNLLGGLPIQYLNGTIPEVVTTTLYHPRGDAILGEAANNYSMVTLVRNP